MTRRTAVSLTVGAFLVTGLAAWHFQQDEDSGRILTARPQKLRPSADQSPTAPLEPRQKAPPAVSAANEYHSRPPNEWQGMLVERTNQSECRRGHACGLALACVDGRCGPCRRDSDCEQGEACVLDHCLLARMVTCRSQSDCGADLCILSGLSADPRGNLDMRSLCSRDYKPEIEAKSAASAAYSARPRLPSLDEELIQALDKE
jgi:hypothetical protein